MVQIPVIKGKKSTSLHNPNFSPIPKLTCLVQNFNIPKPVFHPPGSDPHQFLNPSPHLDNVSKPIDPMILDPCVVASRFEIVAKTTDLTPSEHAGVNLGESTTTIVSTAISESPALSEVIAQQAVKDVVGTENEGDVVITEIESEDVITRIENDDGAIKNKSDDVLTKIEGDAVATIKSENAGPIVCDVCNVTCNSEKVFKRHRKGKIHLKNVLKVPVSSVVKQETSPLVVNDTLDKESEKKNDMLQNEVPVNSLYYCSIPALDSDNQLIKRVAAEQVIQPLRMDQLLNPTSVSTPAIHPSNNGIQKGHDELKNLKDSETIVVPPSATATVSMQTTPIYKHGEHLKSTENKFGGSALWCEVCKVGCSSNDLNRHVSGKKHIKNLNRLPKIPTLPEAVIPLMTKPMTKAEVVNPSDASVLQCKLCDVRCHTSDELNRHISGKKHQKRLKKSEQVFQIPAEKTSLSNPSMNMQSKVVISESSKRKANGSSASEENGDSKKQKMMMEEEVGSDDVLIMMPCKVCNVVCTGMMAYIFHLSSKEHTAMSLKRVNAS